MKKQISLSLAILSLVPALAIAQPVDRQSQPTSQELEAGFHNPPPSAKPLTFWMWINGCVSKEGITADLESFKRVGLGGTEQFVIGGADSGVQPTLDDPSLTFMSDSWRALETFAVEESARLGLEFGTHNCAGWSSSGGPWITPAQSMQKVIVGEAKFTGPGKFTGKLPMGEVVKDYYRDIAVLAFKTEPYRGPQISDGVPRGMSGQYPVGAARGTPIARVPQESIVDLTSKMESDGTLSWDAPAGEWAIARIGHTSTGKTNVAAPAPGTGLECDKMNPAAIEAHYRAYPAMLLRDAGKLAGTTFKRFEIDSYEGGPQDWTTRMPEEFRKRRGYDIIPWLVFDTRRNIIDGKGADLTERFQNDWNLTIAELFAENYYGTLQRLVHETPGLELMFEPYNTSRHSPMDTNNVAAHADLVTAEFWQRPSQWGWTCVKPTTSAAHTWGKEIVAAEAFTGQPDHAFQSDPYLLKATGDRAWALGVNRLVYHTSAHQPWMNLAPGMTMGQFGTHFGRTITWWDHGAREWIAYQARAQYLLQQGRFVGDLCFLQYDRRVPEIPTGYDGDNIGTEALIGRITVKQKRLTLPNGISYAALVLPNQPSIRPEVLRKIKELVREGATVIGPRPERSSSLGGFPACDEEVAQIAAELWGSIDGKTITEHSYGNGSVFWGVKPAEVLDKLGVAPDVQIDGAPAGNVVWIHKQIDGAGDVYFVSNQIDKAIAVDATFRVTNKLPELWHAENNTVEQAPLWEARPGGTLVRLAMGPSGSVFVVFRSAPSGSHATAIMFNGQPAAQTELKTAGQAHELTAYQAGRYAVAMSDGHEPVVIDVPAIPSPIDLSNQWEVRFPPNLGAPETIRLEKLGNLSESPDPGVRYFSGTMTYAKTFDLAADMLQSSRALRLDLGTVKNVAEVTVNGVAVPLMWLPPFRADITSHLHAGSNTIEVRVTNLWVNRLIGDEQEPDDLEWAPLTRLGKIESGHGLMRAPSWINDLSQRPSKGRITFVTFKHFRKDSSLPPSGLIGPVNIECGGRFELR